MPNATLGLNRHEIVRAGAGAGKTYALTHRVTDLAEEMQAREKRWPRIVVTTFTRKATQELRERLMLLALREKPHLAEFVNSRSHLSVSTIHGVLDLYLKRYGAKMGLDPSYTVIGPAQALKIAKQVVRESLFAAGGDDLLETIPFSRLVEMLRFLDGVWAQNPKATPFSEADMRSIFEKLTSGYAERSSIVGKRLGKESEHKGWSELGERFSAFAQILRGDDWGKQRGLLELALDFRLPSKTAKGAPDLGLVEEATVLRDELKELLDEKCDPALWASHASLFVRVETVGRAFSEKFRASKRERGFMEISDLESLAMECARSNPETAAAFSLDWDHWLVDEYQDTSPFQVELLKRLMGDRPGFVVGDPQQSIYLFRGARSEVFTEKEEEVLRLGGERKLLSVNRRSRPEYLEFVNDFFSQMARSFSKMEPHLEKRTIDPSAVVARVYASPKEEDADREVDSIVAHVQSLIASGARPEEIAVLARTNKTLEEVSEALAHYRLPTHVHSSGGFYDRREIRDAIALFKFLVNPHDRFNLVELLRSPWFRLDDEALSEVMRSRPASDWAALLLKAKEDPVKYEAVERLRFALEFAMDLGLSASFKKSLVESGFIDLAHRHDASGRRESNLWKFIAQLEREELRPGFNPLAFITSALTELKLDEANSEGDAVAAVEPDRINLMTIHASKGLEFRHIVLPRMHEKPRLTTFSDFVFDPEAGKWCIRMPFGEDGKALGCPPEMVFVEHLQREEILEHSRVLYVALTRGIDSVFLSWTGEPQSKSFAEMARMIRTTPGVHQRPHYRFEVLEEGLTPKAASNSQRASQDPRHPWRSLTDAEITKSVSVTEILEVANVELGLGTAPRDVKSRLRVASTGTNVHRLMELLKYPSQDRLHALIRRWFPGQEEKVLNAVEFVRKCQTPPLLELIAAGFVEWGFVVLDSGKVIEGQVDLWGRAPNGEAWIIDYKTGTPENRGKAFEQMEIYALALRKSGYVKEDERLQLAAVYPFAEKIFVQTAPLNEAIRKRLSIVPL